MGATSRSQRSITETATTITAKPQRMKLVGIERTPLEATVTRAHAARGLAAWLAASQSRYVVPDEDGDGVDRITLITEAL